MKNITLICAMGMSTSMLMKKMQEAAKVKQLDVNIAAMAESSFDPGKMQTDILLLGPQISFRLDEIKRKYEPMGIKVVSVNMADYGMMRGDKVLEDALALLN